MKARRLMQWKNRASWVAVLSMGLVMTALGQEQEAPPLAPSELGNPTDIQPSNETANRVVSINDKKIKQFTDSQEAKKYIGKPITLQLREADAADVFRLIADASGFNIILADDVKGKLTISLSEVPWDLALDVVLQSLRLGAERNQNVLRVTTLTNLVAEKNDQLKAKQMTELSAPRVTRVFPINYASLTDLQTILTKFASLNAQAQQQGGGGGGAQGGQQAQLANSTTVVQSDPRTNSIIVRDTPENIDRMKKIIELLDTQTAQVMIEAKVVEATEGFSKVISGSLGFGNNLSDPNSSKYTASFSGANPIAPLIGTTSTPGVFSNDGRDAAADIGFAKFGLSPNLSFLSGVTRLNALLNLGESERQVKIVASPKTVVMSKEKASIVQGTPVLVPVVTVVPGAGTQQGNQVQSANLSLTVKPTVTNEGGVMMDIAVSRDIPFPLGGNNSGVANRNLQTMVVVDSGSTLVIGGIYTMSTSRSASGIPMLRKLPLIGALFGSEQESLDRSELFIFITPRILNEKEAGISG